MTLVIMAAGMGSRFGGLKQVEPVGPNGEFILDYSIYDAIKAGYTKVVFIIKKENYDLFRKTVGRRIEDKIKVEYAFQRIEDVPDFVSIPKERVKPWGTSHAILSAKDFVNEPFTVINADDFYGYEPYKKLYNFFKENEEQFDDIFAELVTIRTTIAKKLNFDSFVELGYIRMMRTDYNAEMVKNFRSQVLKYIVPVASKLYKRQEEMARVLRWYFGLES